jgi:hypothetical protein
MQEGLFKKQTVWAILSKRFDSIRNETNSTGLKSTVHNLLPKIDGDGDQGVGRPLP